MQQQQQQQQQFRMFIALLLSLPTRTHECMHAFLGPSATCILTCFHAPLPPSLLLIPLPALLLTFPAGLADPAPVAQTFFVDDDLKHSLRLDSILTGALLAGCC
jgi:hypothetical protein